MNKRIGMAPFSFEELTDALAGVAPGRQPGPDGITKEAYAFNASKRLPELAESLNDGTYQIPPALRLWLERQDGKRRPIALLTVEAKVVQRALLKRFGDRFSVGFSLRSACREGGGVAYARDQLYLDLLRHQPAQVMKLDIKQFFERIWHDRLHELLLVRLSEDEAALFMRMVAGEVIDDGQTTRRAIGIEQGMPISSFLANMYLDHALDEWLDDRGVTSWVRYLDDVVICQASPDFELLSDTRARLQQFGLELNEEKTMSLDFSRSAAERLGDGTMLNPLVFLGATFELTSIEAQQYVFVSAREKAGFK